MSKKKALSVEDWEQMVRDAWGNNRLRELIERDPTAGIKEWAASKGKSYDTLMTLVKKDKEADLQKLVEAHLDLDSGPKHKGDTIFLCC